MANVFIYALKEPDTGEIRYIGKTYNPKLRARQHAQPSHFRRDHRTFWIQSLLERKMFPELEILDEVPVEHWQQWEVAYIEFFKEQGCNLVNGTSGGEGSGREPKTKEHREKIAAAHLGIFPSEVTRQKISGENHHNFGKHPSEATRQKLRAACAKRKLNNSIQFCMASG